MVRSDLDEIFTGWKRNMKFSVNISKFLIICTLFNGIIFISSLVTVCICIMDIYIRKYIWVLLLTAGVMAYTIVTFFDHCAHAYFCIVHFFSLSEIVFDNFSCSYPFWIFVGNGEGQVSCCFCLRMWFNVFFSLFRIFSYFFLLLRILFRIATNIQFLFSIYLHNFFRCWGWGGWEDFILFYFFCLSVIIGTV